MPFVIKGMPENQTGDDFSKVFLEEFDRLIKLGRDKI